MKSFLSILLLAAMLLSCAACTSDNPQAEAGTSDNPQADNAPSNTELPTEAPTENNGPKHYEIELTKSNYQSYLDLKWNKTNSTHAGSLSGVLSFAYYDNVVVTFDVTCQGYSWEAVHQGEYSILLNAAGNADIYYNDPALLRALKVSSSIQNMSPKFTLKSISGKVIFSL